MLGARLIGLHVTFDVIICFALESELLVVRHNESSLMAASPLNYGTPHARNSWFARPRVFSHRHFGDPHHASVYRIVRAVIYLCGHPFGSRSRPMPLRVRRTVPASSTPCAALRVWIILTHNKSVNRTSLRVAPSSRHTMPPVASGVGLQNLA